MPQKVWMFILKTEKAVVTYIDPCGIKGTFVGDAKVAYRVFELAVRQQASSFIFNGQDYGHT